MKRRESRVEPRDNKSAKSNKESKTIKEDQSKDKRDKKDTPKSKLNQDERMKLYNEALNKQIVNKLFCLINIFIIVSFKQKLTKRKEKQHIIKF